LRLAAISVKKLVAENLVLKWTSGILLAGAAVFGGYEGGHAAHWW
jgi:hypothetical protein